MNKVTPQRLALSLAVGAALLSSAPARADGADALVGMINAYRAQGGSCEGRRITPVGKLAVHPALEHVRMRTGDILQQSLEDAGFMAKHTEGVNVSGLRDARPVFEMLQRDYCRTLLDARFSLVGAKQDGDRWQVVLAEPLLAPKLPDAISAGKAVLKAANAARARPQQCGDRRYPPAPPLVWNAALGEAALVHSRDMVAERNLSHTGSDGSSVGMRSTRAGYQWRLVGENIASGVGSPEEAVAGWVASPGHCVNLMNPTFTHMGAAFALNNERRGAAIYWAQVFAAPR